MSVPHPRLDELFVRYWDNTLSSDEANELAALLAADPVAREWFLHLSTQAVEAAELPAFSPQVVSRVAAAVPAPVPLAPTTPAAAMAARGARPSRRRLFALAGGALAAGVGGLAAFRWPWGGSDAQVKLTAAHGTVRMRGADGRPLPTYGPVPGEATVSTEGLGAAVTLTYPDGSTVSLIGDAAVTVGARGRELRLHQGTASADLRSRAYEDDRITVRTELVTLPGLSGTRLVLGQAARSAEVEVQRGTVNVSAPTGEPWAVVREGELLTVRPNGDRHQRPTPATPDEFDWDFATSAGWVVGRHARGPEGPVVRTVSWPDPFYKDARMFQIRSENPWARAYFRLVEDSTIHVRYRAARASPPGQMCFCVRTPRVACPDTGMLEHNGGFEATGGRWKWLRVRAGDLRDNEQAPKFDAPWIAFLIIFNTYEDDIGLEIAEFRVTPPGKDSV